MKQNKKGFTLIELLVVVLIIGILAAVALPQYRKAVEKSRYTQLMKLVRGIVNAQELYYLANNKYANSFDKLDIEMPPHGNPTSTCDGERILIPNKARIDLCTDRVGGIINGLARYFCYYQNNGYAHAGKCWCYGYDEASINLCQSFGGKLDEEYDSTHLENNFYYF